MTTLADSFPALEALGVADVSPLRPLANRPLLDLSPEALVRRLRDWDRRTGQFVRRARIETLQAAGLGLRLRDAAQLPAGGDPRLRALDVGDWDSQGWRADVCRGLDLPAAVTHAAFPALTELRAGYLRLGDGPVAALRLPRLTALSVASNDLGPDAARAIAANLPALTYLNAPWNGELGAEGVAALAALSGLRHLSLRGARGGPEGVAALAALTGLEALDLEQNRAGDAALAALTALARLRHLGVESNGATDAAAGALAAALPALTSLNAGKNAGITRAGAEAMACAGQLLRLQSLSLESCSLDFEGVAALVQGLPALRVLDVRFQREPMEVEEHVQLCELQTDPALARLAIWGPGRRQPYLDDAREAAVAAHRRKCVEGRWQLLLCLRRSSAVPDGVVRLMASFV